MVERERISFQTFGAKITYEVGGERFAQVPLSVFRKVDPWLEALLASFRGVWMETDITRKEFIKLLPEEFKFVTLRTVTNWWRRFIELGLITRKRVEQSNVWTMTWQTPILASYPEKASVPVMAPRTDSPNVSAAEPAAEPVAKTVSEQREETARSSLRFLFDSKWFNPVNDKGEPLLSVDGRLVWRAHPGATDVPPFAWGLANKFDTEMQALIARDPDIRAMIEAARPARE